MTYALFSPVMSIINHLLSSLFMEEAASLSFLYVSVFLYVG